MQLHEEYSQIHCEGGQEAGYEMQENKEDVT